MDITIYNGDGTPWDFTDANVRGEAKQTITKDEQSLQTGLPVCSQFSSIANLNWAKFGFEEKEERTKDARMHLNFCMELHRTQHGAGIHLLHEHPPERKIVEGARCNNDGWFKGSYEDTGAHVSTRGAAMR